jgi:hypothetical protein
MAAVRQPELGLMRASRDRLAGDYRRSQLRDQRRASENRNAGHVCGDTPEKRNQQTCYIHNVRLS